MAPLTYQLLDLLTDALIECGMLAPGETPDAETAQWAFRKANYLVDIWQGRGAYIYGSQFAVYTLVAGLQPHTIGPAGLAPAATFSTGTLPPPVRIESAALLIGTAPNVIDSPIKVRDAAWWAAQQAKQISTNIPTDVYYENGVPTGSAFFWPVPNVGAQVRLQIWQTIQSFQAINDPIGGPGGPGTLPQAFRAAFMLTLAESLLPGGAKEAHPILVAQAADARKAVFGNTQKSPRSRTQDSGMPRAGSKRGDFNWFTGGAPGGRPE